MTSEQIRARLKLARQRVDSYVNHPSHFKNIEVDLAKAIDDVAACLQALVVGLGVETVRPSDPPLAAASDEDNDGRSHE